MTRWVWHIATPITIQHLLSSSMVAGIQGVWLHLVVIETRLRK